MYVKKHKKLVHENKKSFCDLCDQVFLTRNRKYQKKKHMLEVHQGSHEPNKCQICEAVFESGKLESHYKTVHEGKRFKCNICGKSFRAFKYVKVHTKIYHEGKEQFKCNICN